MATGLLQIKSIDEFKQDEFQKINENYQMKGTISTLIGLPTMVTGVTQAFALGSALGAGFAGIGILSGPVIGGLLASALAFVLIGAFSIVVFPKFANRILMAVRRVLDGSFDYRYLNNISQTKAKNDYEKLILIALQLKSLEESKLVTSEEESRLVNHLSPMQKAIYNEIKAVVDASPTTEKARALLARNRRIDKLKKALSNEYLQSARAHRMWDHMQKPGSTQYKKAEFDAQGMGPGRSPFSLLRFLMKKLRLPIKSIVRAMEPEELGEREHALITARPEIAYHKKDNLVCGLLECEPEQINGFAQSVHERLLDFNGLGLHRLRELQAESIQKQGQLMSSRPPRSEAHNKKSIAAHERSIVLAKAENEFLGTLNRDMTTWFQKRRSSLKKTVLEMSSEELTAYLATLEEKKQFSPNKDYYQARIRRVQAHMESLSSPQTTQETSPLFV